MAPQTRLEVFVGEDAFAILVKLAEEALNDAVVVDQPAVHGVDELVETVLLCTHLVTGLLQP